MKRFTIKTNQRRQIIINASGEYCIRLIGEGAHAEILGAFSLTGDDKLIINLTTIHAARYTSADTQIRAVVADQAIADINGTIIVKKNAQQTNSFLSEKVLLVSPQAKANAVPNLEIEADDVSCSHAATVGTIDDDELFYLMSRGIASKQATNLITEGFLKPVHEKIGNSEV